MKLFSKVEKSIESLVGLPIAEIRMLGPGELRAYLERKKGSKIAFTTEFPIIGRGNILRDGIITAEEINKDIDKILALRR